MAQTCSHCRASNPSTACFCQSCGRPLTATQVQGRTVVLPTSRAMPLAFDAQKILQRTQQAFGSQAIRGGLPNPGIGQPSQREHHFIIVDVSSSMGEIYDPGVIKLEATTRASITLILNKAQIDANDEIGLIVFNSHAQLLMGLHPIATHKAEMIKHLQSLTASNGTDLNEGLIAALNAFDWQRTDVVRRIVLLTDGEGGDPLATAEEMKQRGVVIDVVGVGPDPSGVNEVILKQVASVVDGVLRYRFIKDSRTLVAHYTQLAQKTMTRK